MILEAPQMLTPEVLGLPNHASPYLSEVGSRPGETDTQWTQRFQQPRFGASRDPSYALTSSTHLPHFKTPQGSQWGFDIDLWAWKEMYPEERSYCGEFSFIGRSDVCRRCSISDFSKLDPSNTKSAREGSRVFVIVIVIMMMMKRKRRRMLIKITTIHQAHTLCNR